MWIGKGNENGQLMWSVKTDKSLTQDGRGTSPMVIRETTPVEVGSVLNQTVKVLEAKKTHANTFGQDWHSLCGEHCFAQSRRVQEGSSSRSTGELSRSQTSKSFDSSLGFILKTMERPEGNFSRGRASICLQSEESGTVNSDSAWFWLEVGREVNTVWKSPETWRSRMPSSCGRAFRLCKEAEFYPSGRHLLGSPTKKCKQVINRVWSFFLKQQMEIPVQKLFIAWNQNFYFKL